jgi:4-aminobutyrate aminotransferase
LVANAAKIGALALARLDEMKSRNSIIGDVRGRGLLIGVELVHNRRSKEPAADMAEAAMYSALDRGLSFKITMGNVLALTPPLNINETEMLKALDIVEAALEDARQMS